MGVCMSKGLREQTNREISVELNKERRDLHRHVKLLLLGPGESGKSTILKQMQILHKNGFTSAQMQDFKELIYSNTIQCMVILTAALSLKDFSLDDPELESRAESGNERRGFSPELLLALKRLWEDKGIRRCYEDRHTLQLPDCAKHYFDSLDRMSLTDYEPSNEDILFTRVATTGLVEVSFDVKDNTFHVFDVGGQRSERRKWMHVFDNVDAVIFLTAVSEYDQMMREDENTNRMFDSLQLFASICNSEFFLGASFILFLNKSDLFQAKIQTVPITVVFPGFTGEQNYVSSLEFIKGKYRDLYVNTDKSLIIHDTCATDTNQVQHVIDAVIDTVIAKNMSAAGVL